LSNIFIEVLAESKPDDANALLKSRNKRGLSLGPDLIQDPAVEAYANCFMFVRSTTPLHLLDMIDYSFRRWFIS
jgi:hypothetical protein